MENVTINITGDVHIHINLDDLDDFFEDDEFDDEEFIDEDFDGDEENEADEEMPGISVFVGGLPENIDREAVQVVIETACHILDGLIDKSASSREGDSHEGV